MFNRGVCIEIERNRKNIISFMCTAYTDSYLYVLYFLCSNQFLQDLHRYVHEKEHCAHELSLRFILNNRHFYFNGKKGFLKSANESFVFLLFIFIGVPCEILDVVKDGNVTCVTALKPADASEYPGL